MPVEESMLQANVHAMLRRTEEATARAVASARLSLPAAGAGLTQAVHRVTQLVAKTHARTPTWITITTKDGITTGTLTGAEHFHDHSGIQTPSSQQMKSLEWQAAEQAQGGLDDALSRAGEEYKLALSAAGLSASTVALLESWLDLQVVTRLVQLQADSQREQGSAMPTPADTDERLFQSISGGDTVAVVDTARPRADAPLTAIELGQFLHVSDQTVRGRERAGELFSILRPGRRRGVEYPGFQAWPEVTGVPLAKTLAALAPADGGRVSGSLAYAFFTSRTELLGGLSPLEVLTGKLLTERAIDAEVHDLLIAPAAERLAAVERAARTAATTDAA